MLYEKSIYTKAHIGDTAFAQMPDKDIRNLYKKSISFFLIFNNIKFQKSGKRGKNGKSKTILLDKIKNRFF